MDSRVKGICIWLQLVGCKRLRFNLFGQKYAPFMKSCHLKMCVRSEEHTSELQSRGHLVCRLLLEKKKKRRHRAKRSVRARSAIESAQRTRSDAKSTLDTS